jgi:hypothetical protein
MIPGAGCERPSNPDVLGFCTYALRRLTAIAEFGITFEWWFWPRPLFSAD